MKSAQDILSELQTALTAEGASDASNEAALTQAITDIEALVAAGGNTPVADPVVSAVVTTQSGATFDLAVPAPAE